jgi:hypothetical protein
MGHGSWYILHLEPNQSDGSLEKHKARLMEKGFLHRNKVLIMRRYFPP